MAATAELDLSQEQAQVVVSAAQNVSIIFYLISCSVPCIYGRTVETRPVTRAGSSGCQCSTKCEYHILSYKLQCFLYIWQSLLKLDLSQELAQVVVSAAQNVSIIFYLISCSVPCIYGSDC